MQEHSFARPLWARSRWGDLSTPLSARGPGCGVYTFVVRSRPDLTVFLTPTQVCPGERLRARVQLLHAQKALRPELPTPESLHLRPVADGQIGRAHV